MKIKGFDKDLKCRGFQFEIGKTYDTGADDSEVDLDNGTVFHYGNTLRDTSMQCPFSRDNRYCEIEVLDTEISDTFGVICGSKRIRIIREIKGEELDLLAGKTNGNTGLFNTGITNTGNYNNGDYNTGSYNSGDHNSGNNNVGHWNSGDNNTGNHNSKNNNIGWYNSGDFNTGDYNNGSYNFGTYNIGNSNTGYGNVGSDNSGSVNSGSCNSGSYNSGWFNACDYSSGIFCDTEPPMFLFNKLSNFTMSKFKKSKYWQAIASAPFNLTEWVQKADDAVGCLKPRTYKEACANWWNKMTQENKEIVMSIPNFDADVFYNITGIDVRKQITTTQEEIHEQN